MTSVTRAYLRALQYFRDDLRSIILQFTLIGISTLLSLLQLFPLSVLIDSLAGKNNPKEWYYRPVFRLIAPLTLIQKVIVLAAATMVMRVMAEVLNLWKGVLGLHIGYNGLTRVRGVLFRKLQQLSLSYHRSRPQGEAIYRITSDTFGFQSVNNLLVSIVVNVVTLVAMAAISIAMNWRLALLSLSIIPLLIWTIRRQGEALTSTSLKTAQVDTELTTVVQRSIASMSLIQAFGREEDEFRRFHNKALESVRAWIKMYMKSLKYGLTVGVIFGLGSAVIFAYGGYLVAKGEMGVGILMLFISFLNLVYDPLSRLSTSGSDLRRGVAGVQRVFEVLDLEPTIRDAPDAIDLPRQPRVLQLQEVGFEYRQGDPVLRELTATISPGQMVAFVGPSGVGKSTILNLLPRFYDPTSGTIRLDGHDLRSIKLRDLRKHVALVLQESMILPASVAENIAYGRPEATDQQIRRAAELSGAADFIDKLPEGYDTQISENGQNISGGQRQRIGIARALVTEAPILVLDEPTSALDAQNEQMITETLHNLKGRRTIILVSHRLSTVADCDEIYVMDEGRVVERGTHQELIAGNGMYFRMAKHQMKLADPTPA